MRAIEQEIEDVERRMARRRHEVADSARAAKARAVRKVASPAGFAVAAGIGFLVTMAFLRRPRVKVVERRRESRGHKGKIAGAASLLMPVGIALLRSQFGSPADMAQFVLSKVRKTPGPARAVDARPRRVA